MILHGTDFGSIWQASGATNFYGQGWWYHMLLKLTGQSFKGTTFVAKTTTLNPRAGNMPLKDDGVTPKEFFPKSIYVNRHTKAAVNAVSLSGPGLKILLDSGAWQQKRDPFFISLMSLESTVGQRIIEYRECVRRILDRKTEFNACFGIQINLSCPNGGVDPQDIIKESIPYLDILGELNVPIVPKFGPEALPEAMVEISKHEACSALCLLNTLPWKNLSMEERNQYFNSETSPLIRTLMDPKFEGGVSGKPLKKRLIATLKELNKLGLRKPVNAGGGILCVQDAYDVMDTGAESIFLGSIAFLNPFELSKTIRQANTYYKIKSRYKQQHGIGFAT